MKTMEICDCCGREILDGEEVMVESDVLCKDCAEEYTTICSHCGEHFYTEDAESDDHVSICPTCFEQHYTRCVECDCIIPNSDAYYDEDAYAYCGYCYHESNIKNSIHDYGYKPEPIFYGDGPRFFGMELEIDNGGCDNCSAQKILDIANCDERRICIKTDGSLDDGMKIVSYPMSYEYHKTQMPWKDVLHKAIELDYRSHQTSTCGLHVHISRDAFGEGQSQQDASIARMIYFVEKFWTELLRFSRRTECQINHWAARYGMKLSPKEVLDNAKNSNIGRYTAVNLTNYNTIEIRIFRGTLKWNTFLATLQMVNKICDVVIFMSDKELQDMSWHNFLDLVTEPELIQYLKERNLYKNDPVESEADV